MFTSHWPTERIACMGTKFNPPPQPPLAASVSHMFIAGLSDIGPIQQSGRNVKTMNAKNTRKKSPIHENADANITCDFGDGDIKPLYESVATYTAHGHIVSSIIVTF